MKNGAAEEYIAYISYRHSGADERAAELLQKGIEGFVIPVELRSGSGEKKPGKVYRSAEEYPLSPELPEAVTRALDSSRYLIVICSPERNKSRWCEAELDHFLMTRGHDHVIPVLAGGNVNEVFPEKLVYRYDDEGRVIGKVEPLAAPVADGNGGISAKAVQRELPRILAPLLNASYNELRQAEQERRNPFSLLKRFTGHGAGKTRTKPAAAPSVSVLSFNCSHPNQTIRFFRQDLTDTNENYDVIVCSAYRGTYDAALYSMIGSLESKKKISVKKLAENPELNMRELGGWLSRPVNRQFGRVLCVELTAFPPSVAQDEETDAAATLKSSFLTLRHLLERASLQGTEIRRIALPILGAGYQRIDIEYIAAPLFTQCVNMLKMITSLETIDFYEIDPDKHSRMVSICGDLAAMNTEKAPDLFISYASAQTEYAHRLKSGLQEQGIAAWIAPESIPTGSSYLAEIPKAISSVRAMVLLLTEDAQRSRWVQKEVGSAVGAGKLLLPMIIRSFPLTPEMTFLLEGEQFYTVWQEADEQQIPAIIQEVRTKLQV